MAKIYSLKNANGIKHCSLPAPQAPYTDHTNGLEGAYTGFHAGAKQCFKLFLVLKPTLWKTKGVFNLLLTTCP